MQLELGNVYESTLFCLCEKWHINVPAQRNHVYMDRALNLMILKSLSTVYTLEEQVFIVQTTTDIGEIICCLEPC